MAKVKAGGMEFDDDGDGSAENIIITGMGVIAGAGIAVVGAAEGSIVLGGLAIGVGAVCPPVAIAGAVVAGVSVIGGFLRRRK